MNQTMQHRINKIEYLLYQMRVAEVIHQFAEEKLGG